jgi:hypothetical protein
MHDRAFDFHGVALRLVTDSICVVDAAQYAFEPFRIECLKADPLELRVETCSSSPRSILSPAAELVADTFRTRSSESNQWVCSLYREPGGVLSAYFPDYALLRVVSSENVVVMLRTALSDSHLIGSVLAFGVLELIKTRGLFPIHGAALEKNGYGVLLAGTAGSGKTRSCVALLSGGWRCISNDLALVRERDGVAEILAFDLRNNDAMRCAASVCPELGETVGSPALDQQKCMRVRAVVLSQSVDAEESRLETMRRSLVLVELVRHSVVFNSNLARSHFDLLARLISSCRCYRLCCGHDVQRLPWILDSSLCLEPPS